MSLPKPVPGLVLRYSYLWANDAATGADTGKDRPVAIVMTVSDDAETRVVVLPITHAAPMPGSEALEIPADVCRRAGLDELRCWIVLSEYNEFVWPGYDLALIPGRTPPSMAYGFLTPGFFNSVRQALITTLKAKRAVKVLRAD